MRGWLLYYGAGQATSRHIAFYKGEDRLVKSLALSYLLLFLNRSLKQVDEEKDEVGGER